MTKRAPRIWGLTHPRTVGLANPRIAVTISLLVLVLCGGSLLIGDGFIGAAPMRIVWEIRIPRTLLAVLIGGGLGLSGAVLQGALRNPLADPGLLGVTPAAGLGAMIAYYWGLPVWFPMWFPMWFAMWFPWGRPIGGLIGAAIGLSCLLRLGGRAVSGPSLILAGVAVSAIAAALMSLTLTLAPNPFALAEITFWLMGGLEDRTLTDAAMAAAVILPGAAILLTLGPGLDALTLGEDTATSLGQAPARVLRRAAIGCALIAGGSAAVAGGIGFVGLVVPHLLRPVLGLRPASLLGASALTGAAVLLAADMLVRVTPLVLPVSAPPPLGVLTALLGAPFLIRIAGRMGR